MVKSARGRLDLERPLAETRAAAPARERANSGAPPPEQTCVGLSGGIWLPKGVWASRGRCFSDRSAASRAPVHPEAYLEGDYSISFASSRSPSSSEPFPAARTKWRLHWLRRVRREAACKTECYDARLGTPLGAPPILFFPTREGNCFDFRPLSASVPSRFTCTSSHCPFPDASCPF